MARAMKDSGIEWIGEIPEAWSMVRNKNCFCCGKEIVGTESSSTQLLSLTTKGIRQKSESDTAGKVPESYDTYQIVKPYDLVMCLFDLDCSAVFSGLSPYDGMISPAYKVLKCNPIILPEYAQFWFSFIFDGRKFQTYAKNLRYTLTYDEFAVLPILLPSVDEQKRIANHLIRECARIDAVIEKTVASIEAYKRYKSGIIDSYIAADDKEQYVYLKLCYIGQLKNGLNYRENKAENKVKFLGVGNFKNHMVLDSVDMFSEIPLDEVPEDCLLRSGDIVFVRSNGSKELVGRSIMVDRIDYPLTYSGFCIRFRNLNPTTVNNRYLLFFFRSEKFKELLKLGSAGTNINNLSQEVLNSMRIPIPSLRKQEEIVLALTSKLAQIDMLLSKKETLISELEAYKKSLIYEYVSGKKEVVR